LLLHVERRAISVSERRLEAVLRKRGVAAARQQQHVHSRLFQHGIPVPAGDHHAGSAFGPAARSHQRAAQRLSRRRAAHLRRRGGADETLTSAGPAEAGRDDRYRRLKSSATSEAWTGRGASTSAAAAAA